MRAAVGALSIAVLAVLAVGLAWNQIWQTVFQPESLFGLDLHAYLAAAERLIETGSPYAKELHNGPIANRIENVPIAYLYSPVLAQIFVPVTGVAHRALAFAWTGAQLAALIVVIPNALRANGLEWSRTKAVLVFLLLIASEPVNVALYIGNLSGWIAIAVALLLCNRTMGSVATAGLAIMKTTPLVLLAPASGERHLWAPIALVSAAIVGASVLLAPAAWADFFLVLPNILQFPAASAGAGNLSPAALLGTPVIGMALALALGTVSVFLAVRHEWSRAVAAAVGTLLFISPTIWDHYLAATSVVALVLWQRATRLTRTAIAAFWLVSVLLWFPYVVESLRPMIVVVVTTCSFALLLPPAKLGVLHAPKNDTVTDAFV